MQRFSQSLELLGRSYWAIAMAAMFSWPGPLAAQQADYDPEWFDCLELRRDGSFLAYWDAFIMDFTCEGRVCVNREQRTSDGGDVSEVFRHIEFETGRNRFTLTTSVWQQNSEVPESITSRTRSMIGCFTMEPDDELWTIDLGEAIYEGDEIHSNNSIGDYRADYFYAPTRLLGDWSDATMIEFEKMSSGGNYMSAYFEDIYGDVVLKNGSMRATYAIPQHHTGEWRTFSIALDDPGWRLQGGATSIADVLENVTVFQIRSEYASGPDASAIRNIVIR
jgi:hypothetical protein